MHLLNQRVVLCKCIQIGLKKPHGDSSQLGAHWSCHSVSSSTRDVFQSRLKADNRFILFGESNVRALSLQHAATQFSASFSVVWFLQFILGQT